MNLPNLIQDVQRAVGATQDGKAGPETWDKIWNALCLGDQANAERDRNLRVDARSERVIISLHLRVQDYARSLVHQCAAHGILIQIISGTRTFEEQDFLYAQGRTAPGSIVTNARGGKSNHNYGIAFDVGVFDEAGHYIPESPVYKAVRALGMAMGLEWGGNWTTITDEPHFELRPDWAKGWDESAMLVQLWNRRQDGRDVFSA